MHRPVGKTMQQRQALLSIIRSGYIVPEGPSVTDKMEGGAFGQMKVNQYNREVRPNKIYRGQSEWSVLIWSVYRVRYAHFTSSICFSVGCCLWLFFFFLG